MESGRDQLSLFALAVHLDHQFNALTDSIASMRCNFSEHIHQFLSREGGEAYLVLKGCHVEHIAIGNNTLRKVSTDTSHIIDCEHRLLVVVFGRPDENVSQKVREVALRTLCMHVVRHLSDDRSHNAVVHLLIGGQELCCRLIRILVITAVHDDSAALHAHQLIVLGGTRYHQQGR